MYLMQGVRKAFSEKTFEKRSVQVSGKEHPSQRKLQVQSHETGKVWRIQ